MYVKINNTMKATEIHEDFAVKKLPKAPVLGNPKNRGKRFKKDKYPKKK